MLFTSRTFCSKMLMGGMLMKYISARATKNSDGESSDFLCVNNCGAFIEINEPVITSRCDGRNDFQLIYISKGVIEINDGGKTQLVGSGNIILFRPHEPQIYMALKDSTFYWIHFSGTAAADMLEFFGARTHKVGAFPEFEEFCSSTASAFASQKTNYTLYCAGRLVSLIATASQRINLDSAKENELLDPAILDIHMNFTAQRTNDEYAKMCDLSKSHFIRLFHNYVGMPPQKYRTAIAMREAKHLLKSNSVSSTASLLGYTDVFYFSRTFKKSTGLSPSEYKKKTRS